MNTQLLHKQVRECIAELESIGLQLPRGIKYRVSARMSRALGNCRSTCDRRTGIETDFVISISIDLPEETAKQTIMHEMVHALVGVSAGHGYRFIAMARRINQALGYDIRVRANAVESQAVRQVRAEKPQRQKMGLVCTHCGQTYSVASTSKYYLNPSIGRCGNCHQSGKIVRA